jgi:hypothetical protein
MATVTNDHENVVWICKKKLMVSSGFRPNVLMIPKHPNAVAQNIV